MPVQTQMQVRRGTASSWTSTNPTLAAGELGFETDTGKFKIGTGSSTWTALSYAGGGAQATFTTYQYTATAAQTTFSGVDANGNTLAYTAGSVQVYLNGALLQNTADYAATNGTSIVLTAGALVGDSLTVLALGTFTVSTDIPKSTLTAKGSIVAASAASTPANLSVGANDTVLTADSSTATGLKWAAVAASPASGVASVLTRQSTNSNTYTDLATSGPAVTLTTGTKVLVIVSSAMDTDASSNAPAAMDFAVSGATTRSATDQTAVKSPKVNAASTEQFRGSSAQIITVTAGSNTFTAKYHTTNSEIVFFANRTITVIDLGS